LKIGSLRARSAVDTSTKLVGLVTSGSVETSTSTSTTAGANVWPTIAAVRNNRSFGRFQQRLKKSISKEHFKFFLVEVLLLFQHRHKGWICLF
jgi:hypothetical protein